MSESITFDFDNIEIHVYLKSLVLLNLQIRFVYLIRVLVLNLGRNNFIPMIFMFFVYYS